ncbi:4-hydroxyphenylpyruvate dioxygenase-like [Aricia agestis]|uniref:4-hydroxyphenylpyruvate dioxygenase-like n=1 Tax=Aricia agestis TaxID=91739 RepID=UPI001C205E6D|nr:4-hydroxyphenylpyruvate dioxygenase-like [Aricia agestis]
MTLPAGGTDAGVVAFDHLTFWVGNAKTAASYFISRLGFRPHVHRPPTDDRPVVSYVVKQNQIMILFESAISDHDISYHVTAHGDCVRDVAFVVSDVAAVMATAQARGAAVVRGVTVEGDDDGVLTYAVLKTYGDNTHTLIDRSQYKGLFLPGYQPMDEDPLTSILAETKLTHIDHVEANLADGTLADSVDWYEKNLNMKRFWCVDYEHDLVPYSCIRSDSVINKNEAVLLSFNEAAPGLRPSSKATEFVKALGSAGVEHVALYTDDIVDTMRNLKSRGADVLTWPATYYDLIKKKLDNSPLEVKESIEELKVNNILIDFDEKGYMLQAFTKHLQARPTVFIEVIQRRNHRGFGAMNYKWVFETIEILQKEEEKQ